MQQDVSSYFGSLLVAVPLTDSEWAEQEAQEASSFVASSVIVLQSTSAFSLSSELDRPNGSLEALAANTQLV